MRIFNFINGIEGVIAGGVASVNMPVNRRYHAVKSFLSATVASVANTNPVDILDYVRVIVNGVVMRDLTPAQYLAIADLNGQTVGVGELPFWFSEPWRASVLGEEATSWDMYGQNKFTFEFKFKSTAISPSVVLVASYDFARNTVSDNGVQKPFLSIVKQLTQNYNAPAGAYDVTTLNIGNPIQRLLMSVSAGTITSVEIKRDGEIVREGTPAQNNRFLADYGLDGTAFSHSAVFDYEQQISSPLIVIKDLNVRVVSSVANALSIVNEHRVSGYV